MFIHFQNVSVFLVPLHGWILKLKLGWAIVHVCWKQVLLNNIGQANQRSMFSTARILSMLLLGGGGQNGIL